MSTSLDHPESARAAPAPARQSAVRAKTEYRRAMSIVVSLLALEQIRERAETLLRRSAIGAVFRAGRRERLERLPLFGRGESGHRQPHPPSFVQREHRRGELAPEWEGLSQIRAARRT